MDLTIQMAGNGWIVTDVTGHLEDADEVYVCEIDEHEEGGNVAAFARLLRIIDDLMGPITGRYSAKRIHVGVRPGDKSGDYEDWVRDEFAWLFDDEEVED